jgi:hypothetical protein
MDDYTLILEISYVSSKYPFVIYFDHKSQEKIFVTKFYKSKEKENEELNIIFASEAGSTFETLKSITAGNYFFEKSSVSNYEDCLNENSEFFKEACKVLMDDDNNLDLKVNGVPVTPILKLLQLKNMEYALENINKAKL